MRSHFDDREQEADAQRIVMAVDLVPGPFAPAMAARLLHLVTQELNTLGADIVAVNLEIQGDMASW
jgi:hypothetical protein